MLRGRTVGVNRHLDEVAEAGSARMTRRAAHTTASAAPLEDRIRTLAAPAPRLGSDGGWPRCPIVLMIAGSWSVPIRRSWLLQCGHARTSRPNARCIRAAHVQPRCELFSPRALLRPCGSRRRRGCRQELQRHEHQLPRPIVLDHRDGQPIKYFRRAWLTACKAAGTPHRIPHDFRRTAVRNLERALACPGRPP
jgi:hypothetical protein